VTDPPRGNMEGPFAVEEGGVVVEREPPAISTGWLVWAVAVVPVMFIVPLYVFPLPTDPPISIYDGRRYLEIVWLAGLLGALLSPAVRAASASLWAALSPATRIAAAVFVAGALVSALVSSAPPYALREWGLMTLLLVAVLPLASVMASRGGRVLEVIGLTLVLYAILVIASPLDHGFAHPRFLGQALAVLAPALLFSGNIVLALIGAPALALGIVNGSRALMLTLVVVTVVAAVLWPERRRRMLPGLAGLALAVLLVAVLAALGHDASLQHAVERGASTTGRTTLWRDAFGRFLGAPVLGVGPGLLARAPGLAGWAGHPHNSVFLIAAELGLVGLLAAGTLVVQGLRRLPVLAVDRRPWALALIGGGFHSLFSGTIIMPASQAMLVVALALALSPALQPATGDRRRLRTAWVLGAVGATSLAILLATLSLPGAELPPAMWGPRFFSPGIMP
jgi:O-antigen ligase